MFVKELKQGENEVCQVDANRITTACTYANIATYALLTDSEQKNCCYYTFKYVIKDAVALTNVVVIRHIMKCRKAVFDYPSIADDSGSTKRNTKHYITNMINAINGSIEYNDTMCASSLLDHNSFYSNHKFTFVFIWPALMYQQKLNNMNETYSFISDLFLYSIDSITHNNNIVFYF